MQDWFRVSSNIVDREDLSIYEKMCCVVLARYSECDDDISLEHLALKMGVEDIIAKGAFYSLMTKGILESADQSQNVKPGTIIKAKQENKPIAEVSAKEAAIGENPVLAAEFKSSDLVLSIEEKVHRVCEIIDEKISEREARIVLSFANNDIKKITEKYKIAKASQYQDKIEVLMHELQKKDKAKSNIIKKTDFEENENPFVSNSFDSEASVDAVSEEKTHIQKTQLNTYKINLMRKYNKK